MKTLFEIKISIDLKPVKLIFRLYFLKVKCLLESKDEISVLPVLPLLVFLFQTMFSLLVILFAVTLYARNNTCKFQYWNWSLNWTLLLNIFWKIYLRCSVSLKDCMWIWNTNLSGNVFSQYSLKLHSFQ